MQLINWIMFYQYFDNLDIKYTSRIDSICKRSPDRLSIEDIKELYELRIKLQIIHQIARDLSQFVIDL